MLRKIAANDDADLGDTSTLADPTMVEGLISGRRAIATLAVAGARHARRRSSNASSAERGAAAAPRRVIGSNAPAKLLGGDDGMRVLVDRLWPRGLTQGAGGGRPLAEGGGAERRAAPLVRTRPAPLGAFRAKYRAELEQRADLLRLLDELRRRGPVTLVYGARDASRNNAVVLREVLAERRLDRDGGTCPNQGVRKGTNESERHHDGAGHHDHAGHDRCTRSRRSWSSAASAASRSSRPTW